MRFEIAAKFRYTLLKTTRFPTGAKKTEKNMFKQYT